MFILVFLLDSNFTMSCLVCLLSLYAKARLNPTFLLRPILCPKIGLEEWRIVKDQTEKYVTFFLFFLNSIQCFLTKIIKESPKFTWISKRLHELNLEEIFIKQKTLMLVPQNLELFQIIIVKICRLLKKDSLHPYFKKQITNPMIHERQ